MLIKRKDIGIGVYCDDFGIPERIVRVNGRRVHGDGRNRRLSEEGGNVSVVLSSSACVTHTPVPRIAPCHCIRARSQRRDAQLLLK